LNLGDPDRLGRNADDYNFGELVLPSKIPGVVYVDSRADFVFVMPVKKVVRAVIIEFDRRLRECSFATTSNKCGPGKYSFYQT